MRGSVRALHANLIAPALDGFLWDRVHHCVMHEYMMHKLTLFNGCHDRLEAKEVEAEYQRVESEGPASHRKKDLLDKVCAMRISPMEWCQIQSSCDIFIPLQIIWYRQ